MMVAKVIFQELYDGYVDRYRSKDAAGCASYFAENAELFSPYGPAAIGQRAIADIHSDWVEEGGEDKVIEIVHAEINGQVGWCLARYSEGTTGQGTSLNVLHKQADGRWLITQCSLNEAL